MSGEPRIPAYELEALIGVGGMGEVWRARHRLLERPAAIKLVRADSVARDGARERFALEARATADLESLHSVDVYDFGVTDDGTFYYVMELLDGVDLGQLVDRFGPVEPERAVHLLEQACDSLGDAHRHGMIHHDVKPANVMTTRRGERYDLVKLVDFGLVRALGCDRTEITTPRGVAGTPGFLAPEIITSECFGECHVDGRADLYALGCVAYWLLTGHLLFDARTPMAMAAAHAASRPRPLSRLAPRPVPPALEEAVMACLEKDPAHRPQTAEELAGMLRAVPVDRPWTNERARAWWRAHLPESPLASAGAPNHRGIPPTR